MLIMIVASKRSLIRSWEEMNEEETKDRKEEEKAAQKIFSTTKLFSA